MSDSLHVCPLVSVFLFVIWHQRLNRWTDFFKILHWRLSPQVLRQFQFLFVRLLIHKKPDSHNVINNPLIYLYVRVTPKIFTCLIRAYESSSEELLCKILQPCLIRHTDQLLVTDPQDEDLSPFHAFLQQA
jgi:hypothetical protein